ncbi:enamine deaminase RidA (YjgF/YER057c/UK114 family) [Sinobacterium caligoides]|uniref:Enamine deaminase RidA (YjgF/YER057c/UK114 family) n=1 Tax=Sinobacterium caligoides TaxID=933926 RepID=A0A3N2DKB1_9GAMM|nr:RidA family protein [Sinobacterium caligoides]ROS00227.1 enamine deaminase RidA (YjgF/YER057c/UK114 family) [Sinobacterium caligoides]
MSEIKRLHTRDRMSKVVTYNNTIYLCGQVGVAGESVAEQTREAMRRVEALLEEAGSDKQHMLQVLVWLADMEDFDEMNAVWDEWIPMGFAPARACGEAKLARPTLKVELIVTAAPIAQ